MPCYQPNKLFVDADFGHLNVGFDKVQAEIALRLLDYYGYAYKY